MLKIEISNVTKDTPFLFQIFELKCVVNAKRKESRGNSMMKEKNKIHQNQGRVCFSTQLS